MFAMLARGRDRAYTRRRLSSRNTVKAHVKHVYAKLGIHSHQELLDLSGRLEHFPAATVCSALSIEKKSVA